MAHIQDAPPPFGPPTDPDELNPPDVILRSADLVDFHTHKTILSFASYFFRDLFAMPEPIGVDANPSKDGKPVVCMLEQSAAFEKLLTLCYPRFTSTYLMRSLDGVAEAYGSVKKYDISGGTTLLEAMLTDARFLQQEPVRVYAIARILELTDIVRAAVLATLQLPAVHKKSPPPPEFRQLPSAALWKLLNVHRAYMSRIENRVRDLARDDDYENPAIGREPEYLRVWWPMHGECPNQWQGPREDGYSTESVMHQAPWFVEHMDRAWAGNWRQGVEESPERVLDRILELSPETLKGLAGCTTCLSSVHADLRDAVLELKEDLELIRQQLINAFMSDL